MRSPRVMESRRRRQVELCCLTVYLMQSRYPGFSLQGPDRNTYSEISPTCTVTCPQRPTAAFISATMTNCFIGSVPLVISPLCDHGATKSLVISRQTGFFPRPGADKDPVTVRLLPSRAPGESPRPPEELITHQRNERVPLAVSGAPSPSPSAVSLLSPRTSDTAPCCLPAGPVLIAWGRHGSTASSFLSQCFSLNVVLS